jgi:hypothetical protein
VTLRARWVTLRARWVTLTGIFMGLLNDLFPKTLDLVPRRVNTSFEAEIRKSSIELGYQPEDTFMLKITQLREIFEVRRFPVATRWLQIGR